MTSHAAGSDSPALAIPTIVAIGGGGFLMEAELSPIDRFLASVARRRAGRMCFIGTPSGDHREHIERFYRTFESLGCECAHLAFFRKNLHNAIRLYDIEAGLADQDVIYVGGGNTRAALSVWKDWGLDLALRSALARGTVLAGMSAGAICWFEAGFTDSLGEDRYSVLGGLGFLQGRCCAHFNLNRPRLLSHLQGSDASMRDAWTGIDDGAAAIYRDGHLVETLSWMPDAAVHLIDRNLREATLGRRSHG